MQMNVDWIEQKCVFIFSNFVIRWRFQNVIGNDQCNLCLLCRDFSVWHVQRVLLQSSTALCHCPSAECGNKLVQRIWFSFFLYLVTFLQLCIFKWLLIHEIITIHYIKIILQKSYTIRKHNVHCNCSEILMDSLPLHRLTIFTVTAKKKIVLHISLFLVTYNMSYFYVFNLPEIMNHFL
jgi:hypothetical protein